MVKPADALASFVQDGLRAGHSPETLRQVLLTEGWSEAEISAALRAWADHDHGLGLPVPRPRALVAGHDAVLYGLMFVSLLVVTWNLIDLGFNLIEAWLPDPLHDASGHWSSVSMRWSIATLIVVLPLFLWLNMRAARAVALDPGQRRAPLRRRFGAVTLFLAALSMLGAAVAVVYAGLMGVITTQFLAKIALVVGVAGLIIGWFRDYLAEE
jgi:hypothetical protein